MRGTQPIGNLDRYENTVVILAGLGGMLELYDFVIYSIFSVYFASQIFPVNNHIVSMIASYAVFTIGYIIRPLGGIIFSYVGDRSGRKQVLVFTALLMGGASLGIGILPVYSKIGIFSPIILILLRLLQGIAIGGELPASYVYINEILPVKQHVIGFRMVMAIIICGAALGILLNKFLLVVLTKGQMWNFGWRIPFLAGGALCIVSYNIRKALHESRNFAEISARARSSIVFLLRYYYKQVFLGSILVGTMSVSFITTILFMPTYLISIVKINSSVASMYVLIATVVCIIGLAIAVPNIAVNKIKRVLFIALIINVILIAIGFALIAFGYLAIAILVLASTVPLLTAYIPCLLTHIFQDEIRLGGVALSYNLGFVFFGGVSPLVIISLVEGGGNMFVVPIVVDSVTTILGAIALTMVRCTNYAE